MIDIHKSCSCFGHSEIETSEQLENDLYNYYEDLIVNKNVDTFFFGGFGMFDDLCYRTISKLKVIYPNINRIFCTADPRWTRKSKQPKWLQDEEYEEIVYLDLDFDYWYTRIYYRNCEIINRSDYIAFYVINTKNSGAYKAMQYAIKNHKIIKNFVR